MNSLRGRLLLGTTAGTIAVFAVTGLLLDRLLGRTLRGEFDRALAAKARAVAALVERDGAGLEFEAPDSAMPDFAAGARSEYYQIWNSRQRVFARSPSLGKADLQRPTAAGGALHFQDVILPGGQPGRLVAFSFVPRSDYPARAGDPEVTLAVARETSELQSTLASVRQLLIVLGAAAVLLAAAVLGWMVRRGLRPVERLSTQIDAVRVDELSARIPRSGVPRELQPMVEHLNDLLTRVESAFLRERRFTGDVAHELRTPLAGLRAKLELALSRERSAESYRQTLSECLLIDLQLQRMAEALLQLARADAGQLQATREAVDVSQLIRDVWAQLEEAARARALQVELRLQEPMVLVTDSEKLRVIVRNLVENAVAHANHGGALSIESQHLPNEIALVARNTGCTLTQAEIPRLFERFWRGDPSSRSPEQAHYGLGLPLCRALAECLGGRLTVTVEDSLVFTATLRIPREE